MSAKVDPRPPIDRRIAARRQTVREAGARRRLRWLLVILGLAGGGALVAWLLFQSSFLAVSQIIVSGQDRSMASALVADAGVVAGTPTVSVPAAQLESSLLADPWIAAADVSVRWPGTVEITVVEYTPAAWVRAGEGWLLAAEGGAVLEVARSIPKDAPYVDVDSVPREPGDVIEATSALGAVEFLNRLPAALAVGASVTGDEDALRAVVAGFVVDLGYPGDMSDKAAALVALLDAEVIAGGAVISVVSPQRPAVLEPAPAGALDGGESDDDPDADAAGETGGGGGEAADESGTSDESGEADGG